MAITYTGTNITKVTHTGTAITKVTHTGTIVFNSVAWETVSVGSSVTYKSTSYYYHGTYTPPISGNVSPKPRLAIRTNGLDYATNSFGSLWVAAGQSFESYGTTLPSSANVGDLFFNTLNGILYRCI